MFFVILSDVFCLFGPRMTKITNIWPPSSTSSNLNYGKSTSQPLSHSIWRKWSENRWRVNCTVMKAASPLRLVVKSCCGRCMSNQSKFLESRLVDRIIPQESKSRGMRNWSLRILSFLEKHVYFIVLCFVVSFSNFNITAVRIGPEWFLQCIDNYGILCVANKPWRRWWWWRFFSFKKIGPKITFRGINGGRKLSQEKKYTMIPCNVKLLFYFQLTALRTLPGLPSTFRPIQKVGNRTVYYSDEQ